LFKARSSSENVGSFHVVKLRMESVVRRVALSWIMIVPGAATAPEDIRFLSNSFSHVDIIVVAHQDDWQLFMGDVVMQRLHSGSRGVFVYLTAGDDGRDSVYWQTRERAALQSTRVAAGVPATDSTSCSIVQVHAHSVKRCALGNTESYFFRLPDGRRNGKGFARYGYQSLRKLRAKRISEIKAIDGSASYQGWSDLMATLGAIVDLDSAGVTMHTSDPSVARNPHDHFDHRMAGVLVADLRKQHQLGAMYYLGYALATHADNRSNDQTHSKTALFVAYDREMMAVNRKWSAYEEHRAFYTECMQRTYVRSPSPYIH
jgi:LmbE family N-acetylglucosaminyl deacetylase